MAYASGFAGAFNPIGNSVAFTANSTGVVPAVLVNHNFNQAVSSYVQYRIFNTGSTVVFVGYGANSTLANNNATVLSTTANCIPILPSTVEVVSLPANSYFTGIAASGNSTIYITPGLGV